MADLRGKALVYYGLFLSFPLRMVLFAASIYLQNLTALLQLIQEFLILLLSLLLFSASCIHGPRLTEGHFREPLTLRLRTLNILRFHISGVGLVLHLLVESLRIPCAALGRLSRVFRICSHRRTWVIMLQPR
ncbi:uncharacterized protein LOC108050530 [Drosophila rhopaloa]|uniref:Uncharacterized protein LOC108050530 n=1 Tax=Drosophila rhopaloa TaxID=1041015 RepID=A0A6P4FES7_DRORH|nr:uncharacterized protein LOC108050530 [Drosophila rhopaloa]